MRKLYSRKVRPLVMTTGCQVYVRMICFQSNAVLRWKAILSSLQNLTSGLDVYHHLSLIQARSWRSVNTSAETTCLTCLCRPCQRNLDADAKKCRAILIRCDESHGGEAKSCGRERVTVNLIRRQLSSSQAWNWTEDKPGDKYGGSQTLV